MSEQIIIIKEQDRRPNHILHLLLSIVTGGLWIPIWFIVSLAHGLRRSNKHVANLGGSLLQGIRAGMADSRNKNGKT